MKNAYFYLKLKSERFKLSICVSSSRNKKLKNIFQKPLERFEKAQKLPKTDILNGKALKNPIRRKLKDLVYKRPLSSELYDTKDIKFIYTTVLGAELLSNEISTQERGKLC